MKCNKNRKIFIRREMFEEKRANILGKDMVKKRRVIKYRYGGILLRNSIRFRLLLQKFLVILLDSAFFCSDTEPFFVDMEFHSTFF